MAEHAENDIALLQSWKWRRRYAEHSKVSKVDKQEDSPHHSNGRLEPEPCHNSSSPEPAHSERQHTGNSPVQSVQRSPQRHNHITSSILIMHNNAACWNLAY